MDRVWGWFAQNKVLAFKPFIQLTFQSALSSIFSFFCKENTSDTCLNTHYKKKKKKGIWIKNLQMCLQWTGVCLSVCLHPKHKHTITLSLLLKPDTEHTWSVLTIYMQPRRSEGLVYLSVKAFFPPEPCPMHQERTLCCKTSFLAPVHLRVTTFHHIGWVQI